MIIYLIKSTLCSGIMLALYFLFLEKEKMHRFNRVYLLLGILVSFIIPVISIQVKQQFVPTLNDTYFTVTHTGAGNASFNSPVGKPGFPWATVLLIIYIIVSAILLLRFAINVHRLIAKAAKNNKINYKGLKLVLLKENTISHSFLRNIFVSETAFYNHEIATEILVHEQAHVTQKHSWDVLFVEFMQSILWINPFYILYKRYIQLNHEFLADDAVIQAYRNVSAYQLLLLKAVSPGSTPGLTSRFNYLITKKRLVMMTRSTSPKRAILKLAALATLWFCAAFIFTVKTMAQAKPVAPAVKQPSIGSTQEGASSEMMAEYDSISSKIFFTPLVGLNKVLPAEKRRLETIFKAMSPGQQAQQRVFFMPPPKPLQACTPTAEQFESWKDPAKYGIWINEKKATVEELSKYQASDVGQFMVSKLYGGAKKHVSYLAQVNIMTKKYYADYYNRTINDHENLMVIRYKPVAKK